MSNLVPIWKSPTHHIMQHKNGAYAAYSGPFRGDGNTILIQTRFLDVAHKVIENDLSVRHLFTFFYCRLVPTFAKREFEDLVC